jgi:hypothetical protein
MINLDKDKIQFIWDGYLVGGFIKAAPLEMVLRQFWSELSGGEMCFTEEQMDKISNNLERYPSARYINYKSKQSISLFVYSHMNKLNEWLYKMMHKKDKDWIIDQVNRSGIKSTEPTDSEETLRSIRKQRNKRRTEKTNDQRDVRVDIHKGHRRRDWNICK